MKSILYSDTSWTFLKLNTLAGVVAILGHCDIIALITLHLKDKPLNLDVFAIFFGNF